MDQEYVFHRAEDRSELERLHLIERTLDPASRRRLLATGLQAGWRCLEVGPGAGSILDWLGDVVGPSGAVCAIDVSTKFLSSQRPPQIDIRQEDVRTVNLAASTFDLVHARYVLIHMSDYQRALWKMLACLKAGGWFVLEEPDFSASRGIKGDTAQLEAVNKVNAAIKTMYDTLGMDYALGVKLPALLQQQGVYGFTVENDAPLSAGRSGMATIMNMSAVQLRDKYLATGVVSEQDLDQYRRFTEDPQAWAIYYGTVAVSGQRP